jgi:ABC-type hemin transport system ATPase subunit
MTPLTHGLVLFATTIPVARARRQLGRARILATPLAARRRADLEERLFDALASGDRERVWLYRRALGR